MQRPRATILRYNRSVKILDFHTHVFPPEIVRDRERVARTDEPFNLLYGDGAGRMADGEAVLRYMEEEGLAGIVACGFPFSDPGLAALTNDYILDLAKRSPGVIPLCAVNPGRQTQAEREAVRCLSLGARGVGEVAWYGAPRDDALRGLEGVARTVASLGGILMIHVNEQVGHHYKGKEPTDFGGIVDFIGRHRGLRIVLAHLGGGLCFYEFMPEVKAILSSTYYDTAATPFLYGPEVYRFMEQFLSQKVLFGSDFPLLSFRRYREAIQGLGPAHQERLLYGNGETLLSP